MQTRSIGNMARSRAVVEHRLRKRLLKKNLLLEEVDRRVAKYMREYDLKKRYREASLAGKSSYEKQRANVLFEIEWSKIRKQLLDKD